VCRQSTLNLLSKPSLRPKPIRRKRDLIPQAFEAIESSHGIANARSRELRLALMPQTATAVLALAAEEFRL
jgi:hypothetical protein